MMTIPHIIHINIVVYPNIQYAVSVSKLSSQLSNQPKQTIYTLWETNTDIMTLQQAIKSIEPTSKKPN